MLKYIETQSEKIVSHINKVDTFIKIPAKCKYLKPILIQVILIYSVYHYVSFCSKIIIILSLPTTSRIIMQYRDCKLRKILFMTPREICRHILSRRTVQLCRIRDDCTVNSFKMIFPHIFKFSYSFINMQMKYYSLKLVSHWDASNLRLFQD